MPTVLGRWLSPCPPVCWQHDRGYAAAGLPCQTELAAGGAVHQWVGSNIHQELGGMQEVHPSDREGHICSQEEPLKGAATEAQPLAFLPPALDLVPLGVPWRVPTWIGGAPG